MKGAGIIGFVLGAVVGAAATYFYMEQKYQNFYEKEIAPVKEKLTDMIEKMQKDKDGGEASKQEEAKPPVKKSHPDDLVTYVKKASDYKNYSSPAVMVEDDETTQIPPPKEYFGDPDAEPVIISPDEFGDDDEYEKVSLFYYTDGVICDDGDNPLDDIEINGSIGPNAKNHFGEYEDDCVYIRNDRLKTYYELLLSLKSFSEDVLPNKPFLAGDGDVL